MMLDCQSSVNLDVETGEGPEEYVARCRHAVGRALEADLTAAREAAIVSELAELKYRLALACSNFLLEAAVHQRNLRWSIVRMNVARNFDLAALRPVPNDL